MSLVRLHKMNHLLKAMGFWVWGLVVHRLSVSVVSSELPGAQLFIGRIDAW